MKRVVFFLSALAISISASAQVSPFDYEDGKQMMINRALMQYFIILHNDNYDGDHLNDFCHESATNPDLDVLRSTAVLVPEDFDWTNKDTPAIMDTPFEVGSIYNCELACTTGATAVVQFIVSGEPQRPYLAVKEHVALAQ